MQSSATTVAEYIAELDEVRAPQIKALRKLVKQHIPKGYRETMSWGMITYEVPLSLSGPTYNKEPLPYVSIASQKNHISVYLMGVYASPQLTKNFTDMWAAAGKKLDMGKCCVRFKKNDDAVFDAIAMVIEQHTPQEFVDLYLRARKTKG